MTITYASLCDGIGAAHVAWQPLVWRCAWTAEIDPFACAVVDHHWKLPNLGDMTKITEDRIHEHGKLDLIAGGTPCQSFSLAGNRGGLADPRGNLALVFLGICAVAQPRWIVWENVPGVFTSNKGRCFNEFLVRLDEIGYGFCWRVLDAQFYGLPQRRRRVFLVGHLGDWRPAAAVLLERSGLRGDFTPGRKTRAEVARTLTSSPGGCSAKEQQQTFIGGDGRPLNALCFGGNNTSGPIDVAACILNHGTRNDFEEETFVVGPLCSHSQRHGHAMTTQQAVDAGHIIPVAFDCKKDGQSGEDVSPTLRAMQHDESHANGGGHIAVAYPIDMRNACRNADKIDAENRQGVGVGDDGDPSPACTTGNVPGVAYAFQTRCARNGRGMPDTVAPCLTSSEGGTHADTKPHVFGPGMAVRRLTPRECERLQGFPDDYTLIQYRGKPAADSPRYRALGNSMAVPVMAWIGRRIAVVDRLVRDRGGAE